MDTSNTLEPRLIISPSEKLTLKHIGAVGLRMRVREVWERIGNRDRYRAPLGRGTPLRTAGRRYALRPRQPLLHEGDWNRLWRPVEMAQSQSVPQLIRPVPRAQGVEVFVLKCTPEKPGRLRVRCRISVSLRPLSP